MVGSATGAFLPTGSLRDTIDGIELTCMDVAMPVAIARAGDLGLSGHESVEALDADRALFGRMEAIRIEAGRRMGMGRRVQVRGAEDRPARPPRGPAAPSPHGTSCPGARIPPWR